MKVLALIPIKDSVNQDALAGIYGQDFFDYSVMIHSLRPVFLHQDRFKNKSLNILRNRELIRKLALASDAEWFFWVDSDTVVPPNAIKDFLKVGLPLMGGWYPVVFNPNWVAAKFIKDGVLEYFTSPQKGLVDVDLLGLGCCFMHRDVLEKVEFTAGTEEYVTDTKGLTYYSGQCLTFCRDAKNKGFQATLVGDVVCKHYPTGPENIILGTSQI